MRVRAQQVGQAVPQAGAGVAVAVLVAAVVTVAVIVILAVIVIVIALIVRVRGVALGVIVGRVAVGRAPVGRGDFRAPGGAAVRVMVVVGLVTGAVRPVRCVMVVMPVTRDSPVKVRPVTDFAFTHRAYGGTPTGLQPLPMYHL